MSLTIASAIHSTGGTLPVYKLGKLPPKFDCRTLLLHRYITKALPPPPPAIDWGAKVVAPGSTQPNSGWDMLGNDQAGDCAEAGILHAIQSWSADAGTPPGGIVPNAGEAFSLYAALTGFDPASGNNDNGTVLLDALNYWRQTGISLPSAPSNLSNPPSPPGTVVHKIGAYAQVDPHNPVLIRQAINLFGGLYCGVELPVGVQNSQVWGIPANPIYHWMPAWRPGSWGGHCVWIVAYDQNAYYCVSWGQIIKITNRFMPIYFSELYALASKDFLINGGQQTAGGVNVAEWQSDLAAIGGS